jgi:hypothetical protein
MMNKPKMNMPKSAGFGRGGDHGWHIRIVNGLHRQRTM